LEATQPGAPTTPPGGPGPPRPDVEAAEAAGPAPVDRIRLVTYSPRLPPGLLSWTGWQALRSGPVYAADPATPQAIAVQAAGVDVQRLHTGRQRASLADIAARSAAGAPAERAHHGGSTSRDEADVAGDETGTAGDETAAAVELRKLARGGRTVVWLAGPDGDPRVARALGDLLAREPGGAELEIVYGSWDPPGSRLLDVVAVMDRLRSPGGCPWDAEQTHSSLARYLLEEAYEMVEAIEGGDLALLREELGDVLLQVAFHARIAEELPEDERWSIDDVAGDLVAKLVRRHPHVFADQQVRGATEVEANWEVIKAAEKQRSSVTDGVPLAQPALSLTAKLLARADKAGVAVPPPAGEDIGHRLFALVAEARAAGVDPEAALRAVARDFRDAMRSAERPGRRPGADAG
jgi:NTP pyrophosphatase (non-canonical NTP hydrolase)